LLEPKSAFIVCGMGRDKHTATYTATICVLALAGCYSPPGDDDRFKEPIVITSFDKSADFSSFKTFYIKPTVRVLDESDLQNGTVAAPLDQSIAQPLIDQTQQNLIARGYTPADGPVGVDLAVELLYGRALYTSYYCYGWYDWGYWGYPGYAYYYPYSCDTAAWRSGMLVTTVTDLKSATTNKQAIPSTPGGTALPGVLSGVWFSGVYGVEVDSASFVLQRALDGIDQAFEQSPYFTAIPGAAP
jgi:hypothetical protein